MPEETLNASFHGHGLADYGEWWKRQYGVEGRNLAEVFAERCADRGIDIYTLTNEPYPQFREKSRFQQILEQGYSLSHSDKRYKFDVLGGNAFVLEKQGRQIIFLNGQSLRVRHHDRLV